MGQSGEAVILTVRWMQALNVLCISAFPCCLLSRTVVTVFYLITCKQNDRPSPPLSNHYTPGHMTPYTMFNVHWKNTFQVHNSRVRWKRSFSLCQDFKSSLFSPFCRPCSPKGKKVNDAPLVAAPPANCDKDVQLEDTSHLSSPPLPPLLGDS